MTKHLDPETRDLRKRPYKEEPADLSAYGPRKRIGKSSTSLPFGTQARFIDSARAADARGTPLNTLLTLRWDDLDRENCTNPLLALPIPQRIDRLVEAMRKWLTRNGHPAFYIWAREAVDGTGEHWHICFHLAAGKRSAFAAYVALLTGVSLQTGPRPASQRTEGEFACGASGAWHLARDTRPGHGGQNLAAYLGKAEPSSRTFRGVLRPNSRKPVRGRRFDGDQPDGKYDADQGRIDGTPCRRDRFFIAKALQKAMRQLPQLECSSLSRRAGNRARPETPEVADVADT